LIAVFASSNKTDSAAVDHEANRLVFMTVFLIELHKILISDQTTPPYVNLKGNPKNKKKFQFENQKNITKFCISLTSCGISHKDTYRIIFQYHD